MPSATYPATCPAPPTSLVRPRLGHSLPCQSQSPQDSLRSSSSLRDPETECDGGCPGDTYRQRTTRDSDSRLAHPTVTLRMLSTQHSLRGSSLMLGITWSLAIRERITPGGGHPIRPTQISGGQRGEVSTQMGRGGGRASVDENRHIFFALHGLLAKHRVTCNTRTIPRQGQGKECDGRNKCTYIQ